MTTIAQYRSMLRTNKLRLDDELEMQAEVQDRISQEANRLEARAADLADELKRTEARLTEDVYKDAGDRGAKVTVDQVASTVRRHRERVTTFERLQIAQADAREWSSLLDAWKVKGFTLRDLGALYGADYFGLTQTSLRDNTTHRRSEEQARDRDRATVRDASRRTDERRNGLFDEAAAAPQRRRLVSDGS